MSDNSSFDSLLSSDLTACLIGRITFTVTRTAVFIPLYIFILYLGLHRWRRRHSVKPASHSDIFTYHIAALELMWFIASGFQVFGAPVSTPFSEPVLFLFLYTSWHGGNFLHVLTCMERYLAVVHPVVYMRLRNARGVRIRDISIVCVWILSSVCGFNVLYPQSSLLFLIPFAICLVAVSFCSLSVLYVLVHPGPGDRVQDRDRVDPAKLRVFYTITAISGVLWLWFGGLVTQYALKMTFHVNGDAECVMEMFAFMMDLTNASVLPLLYLHRAGKLSFSCCQKS